MTNPNNNIQLVGNLGRKPEMRQTKSGKISKVSIAVTERYLNKAGEKVENTNWFSIEGWNKTAEIMESMEKGDRVMICGQLKTSSYVDEKEVKRYRTYVLAKTVYKQARLVPATV